MTNSGLDSQRIGDYLTALAAASPTPGGGSAANITGALAAALSEMVLAVAQAKRPTETKAELLRGLGDIERTFIRLAADDEAAFLHVMDAYKTPKEAPVRAGKLEAALHAAADVPLRTAALAADLLARLEAITPEAGRSIVSDVGVSAHLALAALRASLLNVRVNVQAMRDESAKAAFAHRAAELEVAATGLHDKLCQAVEGRISSS